MNTSSLEAGLAANATAIAAFYGLVVLAGLLVDGAFLAYASQRDLRWRERLSLFYWRPWGAPEAALIAGILAGIFIVVALSRGPVLDLIEASGLSADSGLVVLQSITFHGVGIVLVLTWMVRKKIPWASAFGMRLASVPKNVLTGFLFLLGTMPFLLFYTLLYHVGLQASGQEPSIQDVAFAISEESSTGMRVYFFILAVVIAPFFEEILFRGIGMTALAKRFGVGAAVAVTSLIFALMHGHVPSLVPLFILSVGLSMAYIYSGSLLVPIVMHSIFNCVSVTLLFLVQ
jgi:hypothetical protein